MNPIEDLVRDAFQGRADEITADRIPPLELAGRPARDAAARRRGRSSSRGTAHQAGLSRPAGRDRAAGAGRGPARRARGARLSGGSVARWVRLGFPVAAAAGVLGVVLSVSAVTRGHLVPPLPGGNTAGGSATGGSAAGSLAQRVSQSAAEDASGTATFGRTLPASVTAAIPAIYIALAPASLPRRGQPKVAALYSSRTGLRFGTVIPPRPYQSFIAVSAAADDTTFAVAAQTTVIQTDSAAVSFFRLVLNHQTDGIQVTHLTETVPAGATFDSFALSPDGKQLAVAFEPNRKTSAVTGEIQVETVASGAVTTWSSTAGAVGDGSTSPSALSWTGDGRTLAFDWSGEDQSGGRTTAAAAAATGLRLLTLSARPGDLVEQSRLALRWRDDGSRALASGGAVSDVATITPDGQHIVAAVTGPAPRPGGSRAGPLAGFASFSVATGAREQLRDWKRTQAGQGPGPTDVLWSSPTGDVLIVYAPAGWRARFGVLRDGRFTPLPQSVFAQIPAAAW